MIFNRRAAPSKRGGGQVSLSCKSGVLCPRALHGGPRGHLFGYVPALSGRVGTGWRAAAGYRYTGPGSALCRARQARALASGKAERH
ncbi:MAG: hypothetical protein CL814_16850 [Confluentimicrobium sp.]|nr:hypothetical protein [Actibacterium sp.]